MKQRLGLAAAMLGDPRTLLFDEPANGLDPEGIQWMRSFLKGLADDGRTVFVSSHLLSEMALIAEDLVVIGKGKLIFQGPVGSFVQGSARAWVSVRSPEIDRIAAALTEQGAQITPSPDGAIDVVGPDAANIGELAASLGATLHELAPRSGSLEDAFLQVTAGAQEYRGSIEDPAAPPSATLAPERPTPPPPPPRPSDSEPRRAR